MENQKWEAKQFRYLYDVQIFAAVVGYKYKKREELTGDTHTIKWGTLKEVEIIPQLINLIALASSKNDTDILRNISNHEAPSILDASIKSIGILLKNDAETHTAKGILKAV